MKIQKITFTGADDSISPKEVVSLLQKYPFVEFALLASRSSQGDNRFPSRKWLDTLYDLLLMHGTEPKLAIHLCGKYVKEILMGTDRFIFELGNIVGIIDRVQINTHGFKHEFDKEGLGKILNREKEVEFIFQFDNANTDILNFAAEGRTNISTLFDMSHGAGVLPKEWPALYPGVKCGYAGGLSPQNITEQLHKINAKIPSDAVIWIDMETHVRSNNDQLFDLSKVEDVISKCVESGYLIN